MTKFNFNDGNQSARHLEHEAADVANFAMMLADVFRRGRSGALFETADPTPKDYWKIDAYTNGYQIVILGTPPDSDNLGVPDDDPILHNCDAMGCSSVEHVLLRIPIMYPTPELDWANPNWKPPLRETD